MASVPGLPTRLGQGTPGGISGLPAGLPLPGGGITSGPPLPRFPSIQQPRDTVPGLAPSPRQNQQAIIDQQNQSRAENLVKAQNVLHQVRSGMLDWQKAQVQIDGIIGDDAELRTALMKSTRVEAATKGLDVRAELYALGQGAGKHVGNVTTAFEPAPAGVGTNLLRDLGGMITGMPAGIGLAGVDIGKDIGAVAQGKAPTHTYEGVIKPVANQYAKEYGSALRGDFSPMQQHPLGPITDLLALFSAGAGTAGRLGRAGEAIDAARTAGGSGRVANAIKLVRGDNEPIMGSSDASKSAINNLFGPAHYLTDSSDLAKTYGPNISEHPVSPEVEGKTIDLRVPANGKGNDAKLQKVIDGITDKMMANAQHPSDQQAAQALHFIFNSKPKDLSHYSMLDDGMDLSGLRDIGDAHIKTAQQRWDEFVSTVGEFDSMETDAAHAGDRYPELQHGLLKDTTWQTMREQGHTGFKYDDPGAAATPQEVLEAAKNSTGEFDSEGNRQIPNTSYGFDPSIDLHPTTKDGLSLTQLAKAGVKGFTQGGPQGSLIDLYEKFRGINHETEIQNIMQEVADTLDNTNLRLGRRKVGEVAKEVVADLRATRQQGRDRPAQMAANLPGFISAGSTGRALSTGETALRETSDLVRAGAIYLRPAYLPNNWAGNAFMNAAHQGILAPVNLAKSMVMDKYIGKHYTAAIDRSMGQLPAEVVTTGKGKGYVGSLTSPMAHTMGAIADQPFRRAAWLHEARRAGYRKLSDVQHLMDLAAGKDEASLRDVANISRKAQEEIVKFGHMNETERSVVRNLIFVYSWVRGASRYAARFPMQHPIQTSGYNSLAQDVGNPYVNKEMGGMPSYLRGSVPVGHDKNGNPILINPFSLNPLGTAMQVGQAAIGTAHVLMDPKSFNKYAQTDIAALLNPLAGAYLQAREGGKSVKDQLKNTIALTALAKGLQHPGTGSIYPTTRKEALGHFAIGSLYPRVADQAAITRSLEKENAGHPESLIPAQVARWEKATGQTMPQQLIGAYRGDLHSLQQIKDFKSHYAGAHGASGFKGLPAANRAEAGIAYLQHYHKIDDNTVAQLKQALTQTKTDTGMNDLASSIWAMSGTGQYKSAWDQMMRDVAGLQLTRKK